MAAASLFIVACLSSCSWALVPAWRSTNSLPRTATTTTTSLWRAQSPSEQPPEDDDSDSWDAFAGQELEYRQFHPVATERSALLSSTPDVNSDPDISSNDHEFELHVGRALDTLRKDYPHILTTCPDLSIYDKNVQVVDPSGVTVHGLKTYQNTFRILHALVKFIYCPARSTMTFRMCFDKARRNIRIHWNTAVVPRELFGGSRQTLHVDGISVYEIDHHTGNITQHRIEQLLINSMPVRPKEGVFAALRDEHRVSVPSFFQPHHHQGGGAVVRFQTAGGGHAPSSSSSSLFAMEASETDDNGNPPGASSSSSLTFDVERFQAKNKSRKKFGLQPLTEDEFMEIELQVRQMDAEQKQRAAQAAATAKPEKNPRESSLLDKLFGNVLKDTCESNWDCERPEVCCDFGFKKMCCSSGSLVANGVPALVPVPVDIAPPPRHF